MKSRALMCITALVSVLAVAMFMLVLTGCANGPEEASYNIGDRGPAGGVIFYDCDADNDLGNPDGLTSRSCGWRYLEVACENLGKVSFGYYKPDGYTCKAVVAQGTEIGCGATNTASLVSCMGDEAYESSKATSSKCTYAAKVCDDYSVKVGNKVYADWFLPSKDEMQLLYDFAKENDLLEAFASYDYWTSSESKQGESWLQNFGCGSQYEYNKDDSNYVLPIRAF